MKKAIFGGTFDPIHNGHLSIAKEALRVLNLDELIFIPSGNPPHKMKKNITDDIIRMELIRLAIEDNEKLILSDYEITTPGFSYTYKTLKAFNEKEPDTLWYFLAGADCLIDLGNWRNVDEILALCTLVIFKRPGYLSEELQKKKKSIEKFYNKEILVLDSDMLDISSSMIRSIIKQDGNANEYLPKKVYEKIKQMKLYIGA